MAARAGPPDWFDRYARRLEETRLPRGQEARFAHAEVIGADGHRLAETLRRDAAASELWRVPADEILRRVWICQFYIEDDRVRWRTAADLAPAGQRIDTPYDAEATYGNKRSTAWIGDKILITETCEPDQVHLITNVETTLAVAADVDQPAAIHAALAAKGLLRGDPRAGTTPTSPELGRSGAKSHKLATTPANLRAGSRKPGNPGADSRKPVDNPDRRGKPCRLPPGGGWTNSSSRSIASSAPWRKRGGRTRTAGSPRIRARHPSAHRRPV